MSKRNEAWSTQQVKNSPEKRPRNAKKPPIRKSLLGKSEPTASYFDSLVIITSANRVRLRLLFCIQLLFGAYAPFLNQALEDPAGDPVSATRFLDDVPAFFLKGIRYPVIVLEEHDRDKV